MIAHRALRLFLFIREREIEDIFNCCSHGNVAAWPAEYTNPVDEIASVADNGVSEFVTRGSHCIDNVDVERYAFSVDPCVCNIDQNVCLFSENGPHISEYF